MWILKQGGLTCETFPEAMYAGCMQVEEGVKISRYDDQRLLIYKDSKGREHKWLPDFVVEYPDGKKEIVEVMPFGTLDEYEEFELEHWHESRSRDKYRAYPEVVLVNGEDYRDRYNDLVDTDKIKIFSYLCI